MNYSKNQLRYENFHVPYLVDETLREGVERCPFPISLDSKMQLLQEMADVGLRDFIVGCGPEMPEVWEQLFKYKEEGLLPGDTEATYIILLNCWETAYGYFRDGNFDPDWIRQTTFSFGMINYKESENTFENAINAFKELGAIKFKASVLNNFRKGITIDKFTEICRQIDMALLLGVKVIRVNDSVGSLQPHLTHQLCSSLVKDYPETTFCLHAHNDTGLAVANSMAAIQAGFQMIEGALAGFGNRSGIAPTEQVLNLCEKNNIKVGHTEINIKKLSAVARFSEDVFMQAPNVFRPVSGSLETDSNFGVLNIPDFLSIQDEKNYFVNYPGLHPDTIKMALKRNKSDLDFSEEDLERGVENLREVMKKDLDAIKMSYKEMKETIYGFYYKNSWTSKRLADEFTCLLKEPA